MSKRAILVGGTSGIGSEVLERLVSDGYEVLFTYDQSETAARRLQETFAAQVTAQHLDLSSTENVAKFIENGLSPAPAVFVNCAGANADGLCMSLDAQSMRDITAINYVSPALIAAAAGATMASARSGYIVQITSAASRSPKIGNAVYGAAKAALERFTASLALEVARFNVRTLCVAPGFVDTPMFTAFSGKRRSEIIREIPARKILRPSEVAEVVALFVRGQLACTGTTFVIGNGEVVC